MKRLLLVPLLLGLIPTANAGIYYYPNYSEKDGVKTLEKGGVKVVCADGKANNIVELKAGRTMQLEGHGEDKYKYPKLDMSWPYGRWANDKNIPCFYKYQTEKENRQIIEAGYKRCVENWRNCQGMN